MAGVTRFEQRPIGVFDSGMGGLSVLADIIIERPDDQYLYYADTHYAPYGEKSRDMVRKRVMEVAEKLMTAGTRLLVIACNTATSAAADAVRNNVTIPVVGMEPALKPAVEGSTRQTILVAATPLTLQEKKFTNLMEQWRGTHQVLLLPCPGLVEIIEKEGPDALAVDEKLKTLVAPYECQEIHRLVLGCTHYVLIRHKWQQLMGGQVQLIDGNQGTLRQVLRLLKDNEALGESRVALMTSSRHAETFENMKQILINQLTLRGLTEDYIHQHIKIVMEEE